MLAARHRARLAMADKNPDSHEARLKKVRRRLNFDDGNEPNDAENAAAQEEMERKFEEERAKHLEEKKAKWNFDFLEERPLEGRWEWQAASPPSASQTPQEASAPRTNGASAPESSEAGAGRAARDAEGQAP